MFTSKIPNARAPMPSPVSILISQTALQVSSTTLIPASTLALPLEILHNLQFQHSWRDLRLHQISPADTICDIPTSFLTPGHTVTGDGIYNNTDHPSLAQRNGSSTLTTISSSGERIYILSGIPPRPAYVHPDLQTLLLKHGVSADKDLPQQREFVLPLSLGQEHVGLEVLARVFDALPARDGVRIGGERRRSASSKKGLAGVTGRIEEVSSQVVNGNGNAALCSNEGEQQSITTATPALGHDLQAPTESDLCDTTTTSTKNALPTANNSVEVTSATSDHPPAWIDSPPRPEAPPSSTPPQSSPQNKPNSEIAEHQTQTQYPDPSKDSSQNKSDAPTWQDPKRLLFALKAHDGKGGDGTVAYYVCLEGEVKPRQNG